VRHNLSVTESSQRFVLTLIRRLEPVEMRRIEQHLAKAPNGGKGLFLGPNLSLEEFLQIELRRMEVEATSRKPIKYTLTPLGLRRLRSPEASFFLSPVRPGS